MIKTLTKRTTIFLLCFTLVFSVVSVDYIERKEVHAIEYLGGLTFETLLPWLLGLVGVTISKEYVEQQGGLDNACQSLAQAWENWFELKNGAQEDLKEWTLKLLAGTLVQGVVKTTAVWTLFKEWAQSLFTNTGSNTYLSVLDEFLQTGTISYENGYSITYSENNLDTLNSNIANANLPDWFDVSKFFGVYLTYLSSGKYVTSFYYLEPDITYTFDTANMKITGSRSFRYVQIGIDNGTSTYVASAYYQSSTVGSVQLARNGVQGYFSTIDVAPETTTGVLDNARPDIGKTGFITPDATTQVLPNSIPIDLSQLGVDAAAIAQAYAKLYAAYLAGQLTLERLCALVQELLRVRTVEATDEATDEASAETTFPDGQPVAPIITQNVSNFEFTLSGLEKVFPFCIPWDIKDFVTLLVAEPVAPVINYPIYNPVTKQNINITIDFSNWETVVVVFRYILDFLLIIGLLLLARQLAGAGGDD